MRIFSELVTAMFPDKHIRYVNKGIGGNRITDLRDRWQHDVMSQDFDWLSMMIGMNDAASYIRGSPDSVSPQLFAEIYDRLLETTMDNHPCNVVLLDPFFISRDTTGNSIRSRFLELLPQYIDVVHSMSEKYSTRLVKTHEIFQKHLEYREPDYFAPEPVHPYHIGHVIIACALLKELSL